MTTEPLDELYFRWLYRQVAPTRVHNPARTYWTLLAQLHKKEFMWFVPNDDNRVADGKYLRYEFLDSRPPNEQLGGHAWLNQECSVLEMMIALSRRLSFSGGGADSEWFWHMIDNLGLLAYVDATPGNPRDIDHILNRLIERRYERDGTGGLFPLNHPDGDQRRTEIWKQMNDYLAERG